MLEPPLARALSGREVDYQHMRTGEHYKVSSVEDASTSVTVIQIENTRTGVRVRGLPSRDIEKAERSAWAAMEKLESGD